MYDEFNEIAPTIYVDLDDENYMWSFETNLDILGKSFGKENIVKNELDPIKETIVILNKKAKSSNKEDLTIIVNDGFLSAYGLQSRFGFLHKQFGVNQIDENIESAKYGQNISFEYIAEKIQIYYL